MSSENVGESVEASGLKATFTAFAYIIAVYLQRRANNRGNKKKNNAVKGFRRTHSTITLSITPIRDGVGAELESIPPFIGQLQSAACNGGPLREDNSHTHT